MEGNAKMKRLSFKEAMILLLDGGRVALDKSCKNYYLLDGKRLYKYYDIGKIPDIGQIFWAEFLDSADYFEYVSPSFTPQQALWVLHEGKNISYNSMILQNKYYTIPRDKVTVHRITIGADGNTIAIEMPNITDLLRSVVQRGEKLFEARVIKGLTYKVERI